MNLLFTINLFVLLWSIEGFVVKELSKFPFPIDTSFYLQVSPSDQNEIKKQSPYDTIVLQIVNEMKSSSEHFIVNCGIQDMIDEAMDGKLISIPSWQKDNNSSSINITILFKRNANAHWLQIYSISATTKQIHQSKLRNLSPASLIYQSKINLIIPPKLQLFLQSVDNKENKLYFNKLVIGICRSYDGIPNVIPKFTNLIYFNITNSTFDNKNNERKIWINISKSDHLKYLNCKAGSVNKSVIMKIHHHPSDIFIEPEIINSLLPNSTIICYNKNGYPPPIIQWYLIKGSQNASIYHQISNNGTFLHINIKAIIGSSWKFTCSMKSMINGSEKIRNKTITFKIKKKSKEKSDNNEQIMRMEKLIHYQNTNICQLKQNYNNIINILFNQNNKDINCQCEENNYVNISKNKCLENKNNKIDTNINMESKNNKMDTNINMESKNNKMDTNINMESKSKKISSKPNVDNSIIKNNIEILQENIDKLKQVIEIQNESIDIISKKIDTFKQTITNQSKVIDTLKENNEIQNTKIEKLESINANLSSSIDKLKQNNKNLNKTINIINDSQIIQNKIIDIIKQNESKEIQQVKNATSDQKATIETLKENNRRLNIYILKQMMENQTRNQNKEINQLKQIIVNQTQNQNKEINQLKQIINNKTKTLQTNIEEIMTYIDNSNKIDKNFPIINNNKTYEDTASDEFLIYNVKNNLINNKTVHNNDYFYPKGKLIARHTMYLIAFFHSHKDKLLDYIDISLCIRGINGVISIDLMITILNTKKPYYYKTIKRKARISYILSTIFNYKELMEAKVFDNDIITVRCFIIFN